MLLSLLCSRNLLIKEGRPGRGGAGRVGGGRGNGRGIGSKDTEIQQRNTPRKDMWDLVSQPSLRFEDSFIAEKGTNLD